MLKRNDFQSKLIIYLIKKGAWNPQFSTPGNINPFPRISGPKIELNIDKEKK